MTDRPERDEIPEGMMDEMLEIDRNIDDAMCALGKSRFLIGAACLRYAIQCLRFAKIPDKGIQTLVDSCLEDVGEQKRLN